VTQLLADGENPSIANHSIRSYLFARLVAEDSPRLTSRK
jgi:hypothetical protein